MKRGFVVLHRKIIDWEWYQDDKVFRLFTHLLLTVNHTEKKWKGKTIKRGQKITSLQHLSCETGLSLQEVRTAMNKLKKTGELTCQSTSKFSLVTVTEYDSYQDQEKIATRKTTNEQQTSNKRATNEQQQLNNDNNDNNDNNIKPSEPNPKKKKYSDEFEAIFLEYPRKEAKEASFKAYVKKCKTHGAEKVDTAIMAYVAQEKKKGTETNYIYKMNNFFSKAFSDFIGKKPCVELDPNSAEAMQARYGRKE